ncbi:MAG: hypothetical protein MI739_05220, partial [Bacteroidales bacterium]|nr:hypothetical protein [Bacteroidales bacterium]
ELNSDGNKAYYIYDTQGNRTRKVVKKGNVLEERFYLGDYELYRKTTSNKVDFERKTVHVSDDNKKIALIETRITGSSTSSSLNGAEGTANNKPESATTIRYQYDNHLGSASLELDTQGQIISYEEYHPFGTTSYRSGRNQTEVSQKRYKYVGKERDEETGLYYYGARYYAAQIARFVSVDPLQFKYPYYTPYQYAGNKPISYIDRDGLEEHDPFFDSPEFKTAALTANTAWGIYEAVGDAMLTTMELFMSNDRLGSIHRKMLREQGVELGSNITNEQLAEMFEFKKQERDITQQFSNGFWSSAANGGLGLLQILSVAYPGSSPQTLFAKTGLKLVAAQTGKFLISNKGLMYGLGSRHGNRLSHVLEHTFNLVKRPGLHSVFKVDDVFGTIDEAWSIVKSVDPKKWDKALQIGQSETIDGITRSLRSGPHGQVYESFKVNMKKVIGFEGGSAGSGADLKSLLISVKKGTEEVITAFPTN